MQTFLPVRDFYGSMVILDPRRLGKQRVEAKQILQTLELNKMGYRGPWNNHPAVLMWKGYEEELKYYLFCSIREWERRGYYNTMLYPNFSGTVLPPWVDEKLCSSHRAALLAKDYKYYSQFNWEEKPGIYYHWPVRK